MDPCTHNNIWTFRRICSWITLYTSVHVNVCLCSSMPLCTYINVYLCIRRFWCLSVVTGWMRRFQTLMTRSSGQTKHEKTAPLVPAAGPNNGLWGVWGEGSCSWCVSLLPSRDGVVREGQVWGDSRIISVVTLVTFSPHRCPDKLTYEFLYYSPVHHF